MKNNVLKFGQILTKNEQKNVNGSGVPFNRCCNPSLNCCLPNPNWNGVVGCRYVFSSGRCI